MLLLCPHGDLQNTKSLVLKITLHSQKNTTEDLELSLEASEHEGNEIKRSLRMGELAKL